MRPIHLAVAIGREQQQRRAGDSTPERTNWPGLQVVHVNSVVQRAWLILRREIQPEQERKLAADARALIDSGLPKADAARRLGITVKRLDGLLLRYRD